MLTSRLSLNSQRAEHHQWNTTVILCCCKWSSHLQHVSPTVIYLFSSTRWTLIFNKPLNTLLNNWLFCLDVEQLNDQQRWCINQTLFRLRTSLMWPSLSDRLQFQVFLSHVVLKSNTGDYCGFVLWTNTLHWWLIVSGDTFIPVYLMCCENHQCNIRAKSMTVKAALC